MEAGVNKIVNISIVVVVLICCSGATASAQLPGACWHYGTGIPGPIYPGAYRCQPNGLTGYWTCRFTNTGTVCPPPAAKDEFEV